MGFKDYLRTASVAAANVVRDLDEAMSADPDYVVVREATRRKAAETSTLARAKLAEFGESSSGQQVGAHTRKIGVVIAQTPIVSAVSDAISQQAGVPDLLKQIAQRPTDPWPYLWLSEALQRMARSRNTMLAIRAPFEPLSAVASFSARTAGSLGADDAMSRCQRNAWSLALKNIEKFPDDLASLHVLARVYLNRGFADQAAVLAAAAALGADADLSLVTLATASKIAGKHVQARAAATAAIAHGCSIGHLISAEYLLGERHYLRSIDTANLVTSHDRVRYSGVDPSLAEVAKATAASQSEKTRIASNRVQALISENPTNV